MKNIKKKEKIEFGDFQTPIELTQIVTEKLINLNVKPDVIIEPTCGIGNFLIAASNNFKTVEQFIGIEINPVYIKQLQNNAFIKRESKITIQQKSFFEVQSPEIIQSNKKVLVLGNFPWVTNSQQGYIEGTNLPQKNNFQKHQGLDAITGKSNFDISEWMLIKTIYLLQNCHGYLAMLCKTSVARKILSYINKHQLNLAYCATYGIDTKKYFNANVESCLLFCEFVRNKKQYFCDVFSNIDSTKHQRIGYHNQTLISDLEAFNKVSSFFTDRNIIKWRSGIKHDCSKVMELSKINNTLINGFGESVDIEDTFIYPLLKGSDVANGRTGNTNKYVIVTQNNIGVSTDDIKKTAPKTWIYLSNNSQYLDNRKSRIYKDKPRFSVFGVGDYSFKKWKIAICGLYKRLEFKLIGQINNKPIFFDDTVYFVSFENKKEAEDTWELLNNPKIITFYSSLIFWDEKRPIKASILNRLDINEAKHQLNLFKC